MFGFLTHMDYMKYRKGFLAFSAVLLVACLVAVFTVGLNLGIDFAGGTLIEVRYDKQVTSAEVERAAATVVPEARVQKAETKGIDNPDASEFLIRTPEFADEAQRLAFLEALKGIGEYEIIGEEEVSATISAELIRSAALAVLIAAVLQILYVTFRFEFRFGVTAVLALIHDVIVTLGLVALLQVQINAPFVAAILTVLGYSINDTIVTFDRIRENLARRKKSEPLEALTTRSIQETVIRSLYTSLTTLMVLLALLLLGGESTWDMAMTLFIGIASGTYSSIFVASALWLGWRNLDEKRKKARLGAKPAKA